MKKQLSQEPSSIKGNIIMSSDTKKQDAKGINRRDLLKAGAFGAAGIAAAGLGINTASAQPKAPDPNIPWTNSKTGKRTAIITDTQLNIGPYLAREMAKRNYNLVIADVRKGLPEELRKLGAADVVIVPGFEQDGPRSEAQRGGMQRIVDAAMDKFGGFDSAFIRTAIHTTGDILHETEKGLYRSYEQNCLAVMFALQAVLPPLMKAGRGQVVVQTSATSEKPHPGLVAYSSFRAAAAMMCRCAALTAGPKGVCVNAVGTNFMNYPGFKETLGADKDPKSLADLLAEIPLGRLGETAEAAHFTLALLDGYNMYTTGNFFPIAGGFNNAGM
jgi:NAD(P)-dependent dehydrogenase (short-subunit alcohol dehydrogenase family)